jgi:hypothetical protein
MKSKVKWISSTKDERIAFLRSAILSVCEPHGAPCGCCLCEALIFDYMALKGEINLKTGKRRND